MMFIDYEVKNKLSRHLYVCLLSIIGFLIAIYYCFMAAVSGELFVDIIIPGFMLVISILYLINATVTFFNGNKIILSLELCNGMIKVINTLYQENFLYFNNIKNITLSQPKWFLYGPQCFSKKNGLTIFLKNNKFYRISPHMERFDELKAKLTEIVEQNRKTN